MNHPTAEQWMSFVYDEVNPRERANLAAHLHNCPVCEEQIAQWRNAAKDLDAWKLRPGPAEPRGRRARNTLLRTGIKWAAAAMIVLGAGFALGRSVWGGADSARLRAVIEPGIRQQLRQEFEEKRLDDRRAIYAALEKLDAQRIADYVSLKKELDTVAVLTDAGLRNTEQQLLQLADYTQTANIPSSRKTTP